MESETTKHWGVPLAVLIVGMFMSVLDVTIVNVAIPTIKNDFGVSLEDVQWVSTAYTLTLGVVVPVSSWLSDKVGLKRLYLLSLLGFAIGSGLCGLATGLETLVAYRIVQAVAGGILPVVTMSIIYRIVPRQNIGMAMSMYGLGVVVAPAVGPTLGGYLVEYVDWRLIFFVNVPVGALGLLAAMAQLPALPGRDPGRFDLFGFLTVGTGLFTLLLAVSEGPDWGWDSYRVRLLFIVSAACIALFVVIELRIDNPLLDLRIFRFWPFTNSLLLISVLSIGLTAVLFYIPQLLQTFQGLGAFESGLVLMPSALAMAVMMPIAGRLYDLVGARWPAMAGLAILAYGTYLLGQITMETTHQTITWLQTIRSIGLGLAMMPIITGGTSAVPPEKVSDASALNNVVQRVAGALGVAALTAMLNASQSQILADRSGMITASTFAMSGTSRSVVTEVALYQRLQSETFVSAMDEQFVLVAALTAVSVVLALLMRSPKTTATAGSDDSSAMMH